MTALRVLHAPLRAPDAAKRDNLVRANLIRHRPTTAGLTEAYGVLPMLRSMDGYRMVLEGGGDDRRRGQRDNPILVRKSLTSVGSGQLFGARASTPARLAPERWITFSAVEVPGLARPVCHICLHPHAAVQNKVNGGIRDNDRGRAFVENMQALDELLSFARVREWWPVVTADINFRDRGPAVWSPYRVMRAHRLDVHDDGLDVIAGHRQLRLDVREVAAPSSITDHPWLLATADA